MPANGESREAVLVHVVREWQILLIPFWHDARTMKWEYKVVHVEPIDSSLEDEINKFGEEEWELTAAVAILENPNHQVLYFRRPIE
jgi:hypothetical protein